MQACDRDACASVCCVRDSAPVCWRGHPYNIQGYLAHKKTPTPLGHPQDPRHTPAVGSWGGAFSHE